MSAVCQPTTRDAYDLLHRGAIALNRVQANGMRIDVPYLQHQTRVLERKQAQAAARFMATETGRAWKRHYGDAMTLGSDPQLSHLLFKVLGLQTTKTTAKGNASVTRGALEDLDAPGLPELVEWRKIDKTLGTYVQGLLKEQVDGVLRPFFHLGTVQTYRSSSSAFNFQNLPVRDPEQGKSVRQAIVPWPGNRLLEMDYGGLEVRIAACYHQDPKMLAYLNGQGDMHRDYACRLFLLPPEEVAKAIRFRAKSSWVFAQFYGSFFRPCAEAIWMYMQQENLSTISGVPLWQHLKAQGIGSYKKFEAHCREVEDDMWNKQFTVYRDWKVSWLREYERRGYIELKTGFRCQGVMAKNDVINYPVQGAAFHCLLWSLIRLDEAIQAEGWETKIIGQIHDSIVMSLPPLEADPVLNAMFRISEQEVRQAWSWIITPLEVEAEATGIDESWYGKTGVKKGKCPNGHAYYRNNKGALECLTCEEDVTP